MFTDFCFKDGKLTPIADPLEAVRATKEEAGEVVKDYNVWLKAYGFPLGLSELGIDHCPHYSYCSITGPAKSDTTEDLPYVWIV